MLKQTVSYTDYDSKPAQETLYFNLTRTEMVDLFDLIPRLEVWQAKAAEGDRELTTAEIQDLLSIIKELLQKSYGIRSEDGKRFRKSPEIFREFTETAVYDEFLFGLFQDAGAKAVEFMQNLMPTDLTESVQQATPVETVELPATDDSTPAWIREDRDPTPKELRSMSDKEMADAFRRKAAR